MLQYELDFDKGTYIIGHFTIPNWPACDKAKDLLKKHNIQFMYILADKRLFGKLLSVTKSKNVPQIFHNGKFFANVTELEKELDGDNGTGWNCTRYITLF